MPSSDLNISKEEIKTRMKDSLKDNSDYAYIANKLRKEVKMSEDPSWTVTYDLLIDIFDMDFLDKILENSDEYHKVMEKTLREEIQADENISLRIKDLPGPKVKEVRELRKEDLGGYIGINGLVKRDSNIEVYLEEITWQCNRCDAKTKKEVTNDKVEPPLECEGCGKSNNKTSFTKVDSESKAQNYKEIEIQEPPEILEGREQPQKIKVEIKGSILNEKDVKPGDHIKAYGILQSSPRSKKSPVQEKYLELKDFEKINQEYEELEISEEESKTIEEISEKPNTFKKIASSISPSIAEMDEVKKAITLQLFGGNPKERPDQHIRGDIHILLVGDPSTAKSQLLRYASDISPRGQFAAGKGASKAGLTAAAVEESSPIDNSRSWTLKAGALPLADGGIACIDELEKMPSEIRGSLHEAMEQQKINIHKAGINTELNSRCGVLAACNPDLGRFDRNRSFRDQIDLGSPLLSRFDLIFKVEDRPEKERDENIAEHILNVHKGKEEYYDIIDQETLRMYVKKAKEIEPEISDHASDMIEEFYLEMREESSSDQVHITPRQLEALVRLGEASARSRLDDNVKARDAERAISIMKYYINETLDGDIDYVTSDYSADERIIVEKIRDIIKKLEATFEDGVPKKEIIEAATEEDMGEDQAENKLRKMKTQGIVMEPNEDRYALV